MEETIYLESHEYDLLRDLPKEYQFIRDAHFSESACGREQLKRTSIIFTSSLSRESRRRLRSRVGAQRWRLHQAPINASIAKRSDKSSVTALRL